MSNCWPKIWGTNEEIYNNDLCSVNLLKINKGGTCSYHVHKAKHNVFYVISGKLAIETDFSLGRTRTILLPGQSFTVFAGTKHQFQAIEETIAIEVMFVKYDNNDIVRENSGYVDEEIAFRLPEQIQHWPDNEIIREDHEKI